MPNYEAPITLPVNKWLSALTALIIFTQVAMGFTGVETNELLSSCEDVNVPNGNGKLVLSADVLDVDNYSATSSLLTVTNPTVAEEYLTVDNFKVIPLSLNEYLLKQSFTDESTSANFAGYLMSIMKTTKDIHLYKALIATFEAWEPEVATQEIVTIEVEQYDTSTVTALNIGFINELKTLNANNIYNAILDLMNNMTAPTADYNEQGFTQMLSKVDLKFTMNSKFNNQLLINSLATLLNSDKITSAENNVNKHIIIPKNQFTGLVETGKTNAEYLIGFVSHLKKVQYGYFYNLATQFFDGSNLFLNNWLHFAYYMGTFKAYPMVKLIAKYIPIPIEEV